MPKISALPVDSALDGNHYVPVVDPTGPVTKRSLLSVLAAFFFNQDNIPDGSGSPRSRMVDTMFDHVVSGLVWTGDAYASTRNASMTAGVIYINGRRISLLAVTARTFTASRDTYIDVLDNQNGTGTVVYTEVTNNNASPALAANSTRIGIIVTGASNILNVGSVNQGQEQKILPIVSSIPYAVTDSLGNLICPRDPNRKVLGYRRVVNSPTVTTIADITGLAVPVIVPAGRKIRITHFHPQVASGGAAGTVNFCYLYEGATFLMRSGGHSGGANYSMCIPLDYQPPDVTAGLHTYKVRAATTSGTLTMSCDDSSSLGPAFIRVELV